MKKYRIRKNSPIDWAVKIMIAAMPFAVIVALGVATTMIDGGGVIR